MGFLSRYSSCFSGSVFVLGSIASTLVPSFASADATAGYIIYADPNKPQTAASTLSRSNNGLANLGLAKVEQLGAGNTFAVKADSAKLEALSKELEARGMKIEPDSPVGLLAVPNDRYYGHFQPDMAAINTPQAWDISTGSSDIVVGIIDTGIDYTHPDLVANTWNNPFEQANGIDDDGNGLVDDLHGMNAVASTGDPLDDHYHGTHVAGTVGASGNNNLGVSGVNWNVKLMALKVLDSEGSGTSSGIIKAIQYAISMKQQGVNIRVLNASLGGAGHSNALQAVITQARNEGILFVAAAGNESSNNDSYATYPANYEHVISVAATENDGELAYFSNFGSTKVHLAAPGVDIVNTIPLAAVFGDDAAYAYLSGTSMAAPHVAGAAALLLSVSPELTADQVRVRLMETATPINSLSGKMVAGGMLNVYGALINDKNLSLTSQKITGRVLFNKKPLKGVKISGTFGTTTTDSKGNFSFNNLSWGAGYTITVSKKGYEFSPSVFTGVAAGNKKIKAEASKKGSSSSRTRNRG